MTAVTCRDATLADAAPLADLFTRAFTETFAQLYDPRDLRIAFAGQPVGFAKLGPANLPGELEPWQGSGMGPTLYDWAVGRARGRGAEHLQLTVYVHNDRAKAFYARRGFVEIGPYAFMVGNQADEDIIMPRRL